MRDIENYSLGINFLDYVRTELVNFRGFKSLAFELIQNAQDCNAEWIQFDFRPDCLVVSNSQKFKMCPAKKSMHCSLCPPCDFHRLRNVASGGKRTEANAIGNFGIGFISVYAYTDKPIIRSGKYSWTIVPDAKEEERLQEQVIEEIGHTEIILPWAFDLETPTRKALGQVGVKRENLESYAKILVDVAPNALLFLEDLCKIEILQNGKPIKTVLKDNSLRRQEGIISITADNETFTWHLFEKNFHQKAKQLRATFNKRTKLIEDKRKSDVMLAYSAEAGEQANGLLYAQLPTESPSKFPFHINGDFFPSTDRKRIVLDGDEYDRHWNEAVLQCAAECFAEDMEDIGKDVTPKVLLKCLAQAHSLEKDSIWSEFWNCIKDKSRDARIVRTSAGNWVTTSEAYLHAVDLSELDTKLLDSLDLQIVDPELRSYRNVLLALGIKDLDFAAVARSIMDMQTPGDSVKKAQAFLSEPSLRLELYTLLARLYQQKQSGIKLLKEQLRALPIAVDLGGIVRNFGDVYKATSDTHQVFGEFYREQLADPHEMFESQSGLWEQLKLFEVPEALQCLQEFFASHPVIFRENLNNYDQLNALHRWFEEREEGFSWGSTKSNYLKLNIFPNARSLSPCGELLLPSAGIDCLELIEDELIDTSGIAPEIVEFWQRQGVRRLDWPTQVERICRKFESAKSNEIKHAVVQVLSENFEAFAQDKKAMRLLNGTPVIFCLDHKWRAPDSVYFESEVARQVLADSIGYVPKDGSQLSNFYRLIGALENPHVEDILQHIKNLAASEISAEVLKQIQSVFSYLDQSWDGFSETELAVMEPLRKLKWLPAAIHGNQQPIRFCAPDSVFLTKFVQLFYSNGQFLSLEQPSSEKFIAFLGLKVEPSVESVAKHLLWCRTNRPTDAVNPDIYEFLNARASHEESTIRELLGLEDCIYLNDEWYCGRYLFWRDNKLGRWRKVLSSEHSSLRPLFNILGVRQKCDARDYVDVIIEISKEYANGQPIIDEEKNVLLYCSAKLNKLVLDQQDEDAIDQLEGLNIIPNLHGVLLSPADLLFGDKAVLVQHFADRIAEKLILKDTQTSALYERLGVRTLSKLIRSSPHQITDARRDGNLTMVLQERVPCIGQIVERQKITEPTGWRDDILDSLEIWAANDLREIIEIPDLGLTKDPLKVDSLFDSQNNRIYVELSAAQPHLDIASVLARVLNPDVNTCNIVSTIHSVLTARSYEHAQDYLFRIGFDIVKKDTPLDGVSSEPVDFKINTGDPHKNEEQRNDQAWHNSAETPQSSEVGQDSQAGKDKRHEDPGKDATSASNSKDPSPEEDQSDTYQDRDMHQAKDTSSHQSSKDSSTRNSASAAEKTDKYKSSTSGKGRSKDPNPKKDSPFSYHNDLGKRFNRKSSDGSLNEWVARPPLRDVSRRAQKIREEIKQAKSSTRGPSFEYKLRKVWSSKNPIVREFLQNEYGSKCQICEFTFQTRSNTSYFEAFYLVSRIKEKWIDRSGNALCLCANCCARMQHGAVEWVGGVEIVDVILALDPSSMQEFYTLEFKLCNENSSLRISHRHLIEMQTLIEESRVF
ncbi:MAG: hypothetical protein K2X77_07175 [Candidatus Obscuribacterales bacterium]|nr:hypothetical protein [Candidatus Obscuribacterales bacterium]